MSKDQKVTLGFKLSDGSEQQVTFTVPAGKDGSGSGGNEDLSGADFSGSALVDSPTADKIVWDQTEQTVTQAHDKYRSLTYLPHAYKFDAIKTNSNQTTNDARKSTGVQLYNTCLKIGKTPLTITCDPVDMSSFRGTRFSVKSDTNTVFEHLHLNGDGLQGYGTYTNPVAIYMAPHEDQALSVVRGGLFSPTIQRITYNATLKNAPTDAHEGLRTFPNTPYVEFEMRTVNRTLQSLGVSTSWHLTTAHFDTPKTPGTLDSNGQFQAIPYTTRHTISGPMDIDFTLCFAQMPTHIYDPASSETIALSRSSGTDGVSLPASDNPVEIPYTIRLEYMAHLIADLS